MLCVDSQISPVKAAKAACGTPQVINSGEMGKADADVAIEISEFADKDAAVLKRGQTFGAQGMHITVQVQVQCV